MNQFTRERLKELLSYDPETGVFTWRIARAGARGLGRAAGYKRKNGYVIHRLDGGYFLSHRLAWFYIHGAWPKGEIDHINRDPSDNRISNLREATSSENKHNRALNRNNSSGYKGVYFDKRDNKWVARIMINRKSKPLGYHDTPEAAYEAYKTAAAAVPTHVEAALQNH